MNAKAAKYIRQQVRLARTVFGGEDLTITKDAKRHWDRGTENQYAGDDSVLPFLCPCGERVAVPSYSVRRDQWVTAPHGTTKVEFGPFKSRSGRVYFKPVRLVKMCRGFEAEEGETEAPKL